MDQPPPSSRATTLPHRARAVVIGGGAIGTSIAYHLAKLGWTDTVLLERRQLTAGTTWHAAGLITSAGMSTETLLWMSRYTRDLCTTLEAETGQSTGFRPIGHLHLATTPQRLETLRREAAFVRGFGVVLFGDASFPSWHARTARNVRRSVVHDRMAAAGAHFGVSSGWEYAEWFDTDGVHPEHPPQGWGRTAGFACQAAEHRAVREAVGVLDMSVMAKFLVQGRDADAVLNRVCANDVAVPVGRIVYTQWLNEAGGIVADLTVTRLGETRFMVVVTDLIHRRMAPWIERHVRDGEFVTVTDVTAGTTLLTVQGPRSRYLISQLTSADLSNEAFPFLTAREIDVGYARVLAMRVTYVGELGWELHVPADLALTVWDALHEAGAPYGFRHVGLGAMGSLRLEKAYRDFGLDIDNTDTPLDVGLGFAVAWDKPGGFTGRDALLRAREARAGKPPTRRLVQFLVEDPEPLLYHGEPILRDGAWFGYNRAGAYGHTLGGAVGLAMVEDEHGIPAEAIDGARLEVDIAGVRYPVRASLRPMYDPDRLRILACPWTPAATMAGPSG